MENQFGTFVNGRPSSNLDGWKFNTVDIGMTHRIVISITLSSTIKTETGQRQLLVWMVEHFVIKVEIDDSS